MFAMVDGIHRRLWLKNSPKPSGHAGKNMALAKVPMLLSISCNFPCQESHYLCRHLMLLNTLSSILFAAGACRANDPLLDHTVKGQINGEKQKELLCS